MSVKELLLLGNRFFSPVFPAISGLGKVGVQANARVLGIDLEGLEAREFSLDNSSSGNVDMFIAPLWRVTIQVTWGSSKYQVR